MTTSPQTTNETPADRRDAGPPVHRVAGPRDRAQVAGPLGRRRHVRVAEPVGPLADPEGVASRGPKLFILDMFPYPSGTGLHVGHPLGFTGTDVYARYQRMAGRNVLYTMGFDAFGLPAEQFAVQTGHPPGDHHGRQHRHLPPPDPPARVEPRPAALDRHHGPRLLPVDAVDLHPDLRVLVRPGGRATRWRRRAGPADRRTARRARRRHPDPGRRASVVGAVGDRAGRRDRRVPAGLRRRTLRSTGARAWARSSPTRRSPPTAAAIAATSRCSSATCASG